MKIKLNCNSDNSDKVVTLFVYDFDGVMTDNKVTVDQFGNESVVVNRGDGLAISEIKKMGLPQLIISTEKNVVVQKRADKLQINCFQGIGNKKDTLQKYLSEAEMNPENVLYVGNDINDLEVMKICGTKVAPADAAEEILAIADLVTAAKGGEGVIREIFNKLDKIEI